MPYIQMNSAGHRTSNFLKHDALVIQDATVAASEPVRHHIAFENDGPRGMCVTNMSHERQAAGRGSFHGKFEGLQIVLSGNGS